MLLSWFVICWSKYIDFGVMFWWLLDHVIWCCYIVISCFGHFDHFVKNVNFVIYRVLWSCTYCIIFHVSFIYDFGQGWFCYLRSIWMIWNDAIFLCFLFCYVLHVMLCISCLYLFKVPTLLMVILVILVIFGVCVFVVLWLVVVHMVIPWPCAWLVVLWHLYSPKSRL